MSEVYVNGGGNCFVLIKLVLKMKCGRMVAREMCFLDGKSEGLLVLMHRKIALAVQNSHQI
jgi:hypothetical protein